MRKVLVGTVAAVVLASTATAVAVAASGDDSATESPAYLDASRPVAERVDDLLGRMSLADKVGQMTQVDRSAVADDPKALAEYRIGSVLSGGGSAPPNPEAEGWADMYDTFQRAALGSERKIPIIYGVDAVHGHNNVRGATIFPHNIGLGATRDPALVEEIGRATADEVAATGLDWNFAPCLCVARDDRWGRTYESFGEDPEIATAMTSYITGLQGQNVLATAKHYIGDGGTTGGDDQGDTRLSEADLKAIHLPPFAEAVRKGVGSVMVSFSSWNGQKAHGHKYLITDLLKGELAFTGFVVSDWAGIDQIDGARGFTAEEVRQGVNAGIDMVMVPEDYRQFTQLLTAEVEAGRVPVERIDDANRRILAKKFELGLFEHPYAERAPVGTPEHRALARRAVRQSQVLLKNDGNVLPLKKDSRIFVAGKNADDIGNQSGGWTMTWQGKSGPITPGTTILAGIREVAKNVTYDRGGEGIDGSYDVAVAVVGETPYAEYEGDRPGGLTLDQEDLQTLSRLNKAGIPVVVVLVSGRPLAVPASQALLAAWLPGTEGGGVADVLFGIAKPTGKLPVSWPATKDQQPVNKGDGKRPLFAYGHGLSY
ncbi:glycoside hydrolase family 3 protein [Micromonospora sp. CPCC 206061]|uniref:glycoside hydrolase family 3 protein n=1 Tax=Micromonospora sp. CPCC 206061 TaxID=3122410 RepID=UPI002FF172B1